MYSTLTNMKLDKITNPTTQTLKVFTIQEIENQSQIARVGKQQYPSKIGKTENCLRRMLNRESFNELL